MDKFTYSRLQKRRVSSSLEGAGRDEALTAENHESRSKGG